MLKYRIKLVIYWTYEKELGRNKTTQTGIYKTPYHKGGTLNDIFLINKCLITFSIENPEAVIYEIDVIELNQVEEEDTE